MRGADFLSRHLLPRVNHALHLLHLALQLTARRSLCVTFRLELFALSVELRQCQRQQLVLPCCGTEVGDLALLLFKLDHELRT
ncbi:MAG: hypothetical protein ACK55Z_06275, partial [bacterium]